MSSYRSSSPISGFSGHIPGKKWQVGGRNLNSKSSERVNNSEVMNQPLNVQTAMQNGAYSPEQMAQLYQQQLAQMQASGQVPPMYPYYGFNPYMMNGFNPSASMHGLNHLSAATSSNQQISPGNSSIHNDSRSITENSTKNRSKSLPRKIKSDVRDIFGGIESGWWSEGQALKNLKRHQQALGDRSGNIDPDTTVTSTKSSRKNLDYNYDSDVPTPGYSGHVPGIRQYGIGKPFTIAAKEARRIMHSNDSTQMSSSSANSAAIKARNNQNNNSNSSLSMSSNQHNLPYPSMNGYNPFANSTQNPFMQSYPYGMMPMYMNNLQQMPMNQMPPQSSSEYDNS